MKRTALFVYSEPAELARIKRAAKAAGFVNVSEYVRQVLKKDVDRRLTPA